MKIPTSVKQAKKLGYSVRRMVRYYAVHPHFPAIELPYDAHIEIAYNWRKKARAKA